MKRLRSASGQSLVELAIGLPILLALIIGIAEFGRAWNVRQVTTNAAREGARLGVIQGALEADVRTAIDSRLTDAGLNPGDATVSIVGMNTGPGPGNSTSVQIDYPFQFQFIGPVVDFLNPGGSAIPGSITMSTTATMRNE